jgi:hypothetical protein
MYQKLFLNAHIYPTETSGFLPIQYFIIHIHFITQFLEWMAQNKLISWYLTVENPGMINTSLKMERDIHDLEIMFWKSYKFLQNQKRTLKLCYTEKYAFVFTANSE